MSDSPPTRRWRKDAARPWGQQTARSASDTVASAFDRDSDEAVVDAIETLARSRGVSMAQVALAWVLSKPVVACPIVGATKPHHLADAVAALDVKLTTDEVNALEAPYRPGQLLVVSTPAPKSTRATVPA